jgi:hypothetical protein
MQTTYKKIEDLIKDEKGCPIPLSVIPNNMGINLCSVDAISWQRCSDNQLSQLTIYFLPDEDSLAETKLDFLNRKKAIENILSHKN